MHEVSIAQAIVAAVIDAVDGAEVESVDVRVGALSGVVASALEFAWDVVTVQTPLAGSALVVETVPTTVYCSSCRTVVAPLVGFLCPGCGALSGELRSGRELEVVSARLREQVGTAP